MDDPKKRYREAFADYGASPRALKWNTYTSAALRYREIVATADCHGRRIIDVGCGFGDIIPFIVSATTTFDYTGIDIVPEFITEAERRYPDFDFIVGDYFQELYRFEADLVFCNGAFNTKDNNPVEVRKECIERMFTHAKEGIVFTMAGHYPQPVPDDESSIYYADALEILRYCSTLSSRLVFKQHYHERDFLIGMFKG